MSVVDLATGRAWSCKNLSALQTKIQIGVDNVRSALLVSPSV